MSMLRRCFRPGSTCLRLRHQHLLLLRLLPRMLMPMLLMMPRHHCLRDSARLHRWRQPPLLRLWTLPQMTMTMTKLALMTSRRCFRQASARLHPLLLLRLHPLPWMVPMSCQLSRLVSACQFRPLLLLRLRLLLRTRSPHLRCRQASARLCCRRLLRLRMP